MAKLTPKEEQFALKVAQGHTATRAYREVYEPRATVRTDKVHKMAYEVRHKPHVSARIDELQANFREEVGGSVVKHLAALGTLRDAALRERNFASAVRAEELRGRLMGFYNTPSVTINIGSFEVVEYGDDD